MTKIELDKYYTPSDIAEYCVKKTEEIVGKTEIVEYLEPSAGQGVFLDFLDVSFKAYDIAPECDDIIQQDFLELDLNYKEGRCIIGNPPYGKGNYLAVKFYKKAIELGDYISFILPVSQLNNNMYMYEFDMIHSEDLGKILFSGKKKVHCCLNIYKRNKNGYNAKPNFDLRDVTLKGVATGASRNDKVPDKYDFSICGFGSSVGKKCDSEGQYCQQIYVTIHNQDLKNEIHNIILHTDWKSEYAMTATPKLKHWMIYKKLKESVEGIT